MAIYRNIELGFWDDPKVEDDFTPEDKYFFLFVLTNPYTNLCGCYEISLKQMARKTGYNEETVKRLVERLQNVHNVIRYDFETKELLIPNWYKYNWTRSEKLEKPILSQINKIKSDDFKAFLTDLFYTKDRVSIRYPYPIDTTVSVSVSDTITDTITEEVKEIYPKCIQNVSVGKDRLGKDRLGKVKNIVEYLNSATGKNFRSDTSNTVKHINARLNEGYSVEDFKTVIDTKVKEWKGNDQMEKYLRPDTLFGSKFESYLNQGGKNNEQLGETGGYTNTSEFFKY